MKRRLTWLLRYSARLLFVFFIVAYPHAIPVWAWLAIAGVFAVGLAARYVADRRHGQPWF